MAKACLRHLKGTKLIKMFRNNENLTLTILQDSDCASIAQSDQAIAQSLCQPNPSLKTLSTLVYYFFLKEALTLSLLGNLNTPLPHSNNAVQDFEQKTKEISCVLNIWCTC